jgi:hypothetical protein
MAKVHTMLSMKVKAGSEAAYRAWPASAIGELSKVFARTGIHEKVVMMSGQTVLAHYESDAPGAVEAAFQSPEATAMMAGSLGQMLDFSSPPVFYKEELCWESGVSGPLKRAAIALNLKAGQETRYLDWVRNRAKGQFDALWKRFDVARKEVLVNGLNVVSFYVIRDPSRILPSFGEPEAIAAMQADLGTILDIDATKPPLLCDEIFYWHD